MRAVPVDVGVCRAVNLQRRLWVDYGKIYVRRLHRVPILVLRHECHAVVASEERLHALVGEHEGVVCIGCCRIHAFLEVLDHFLVCGCAHIVAFEEVLSLAEVPREVLYLVCDAAILCVEQVEAYAQPVGRAEAQDGEPIPVASRLYCQRAHLWQQHFVALRLEL